MKNLDFILEFVTFAEPEDGYSARRVTELMLNRPDWWVLDFIRMARRSIISIGGVFVDIWRDD